MRPQVAVMGRNLPAVDATCARIMGIDPHRVPYLAAANRRLGPVYAADIIQVGEPVASVRTDFKLLDKVPAQRGLRLLSPPSPPAAALSRAPALNTGLSSAPSQRCFCRSAHCAESS